MRNDLQAAVEYLENQLELVRRYTEGYPDKDNYTALADIYTTALDTTLSALRDALQRQPDPDTGLVPCGCGGKANIWPSEPTQFTKVITDYEVGCTECAMTTGWVRGKQENAVKVWNTAMGWKDGTP